jgi:glycosyltransferase involved in cell wall biosynthesis
VNEGTEWQVVNEEIESANIKSEHDFFGQQAELRGKLDLLRAELASEREREKQLTARLEEKSVELREAKRQFEAVERERRLSRQRYTSLRRSRAWRYTTLARHLAGVLRRVIRPAAGPSRPAHHNNTQTMARKDLKQRDLGRQADLRRYRIEVNQLKLRLQSLGFTDRALQDLRDLADDGSEPILQKLAARELALWHANQRSEEDARQCLEFLSRAMRGKNNSVLLPRQVAILEAECQEMLGNMDAARGAISRALASESHADLFLANANLETSALAKVEWINRALGLYDTSPISLDESSGRSLFDSLESGRASQERGAGEAKVSVIMPVYNSEETLRTALDSVLSQTWTNLEVLVVDDCSSDGTVPIVEEYARRDSRVRLIRAETNGGPYVARNLALRIAGGDFVTCHDADDWSHPEKIERQARHLLENPSAVGNTSQLVRAMADLTFFRRGNPGFYIFNSMPSFMFRREPVMDAVGYWDCVRFGADTEFTRRVKKVFGNESVVNMSTGPLSFQRQSSSSLTGNEAFGYHGYFAGARREYFEAHNYFHEVADNLRYEFPQRERPFAVPEPMWPVREVQEGVRRHFDIILVSDFRLMGGSTLSSVEEIKAQKRLGLRTGLVQMARYDLAPGRKINPKIRELLDGDQVQMLVYGEKVSCDVLVLRYPPILQEWQRFVPDVETERVHVVVNQTPMRGYGDDGELAYTISRCRKHLQRYFGKAGVWHPIGPLVREALYQYHTEELGAISLSYEDWLNIINVEEWRREARPPRRPRPRIGRHSRDHSVKWPADPEELLAIYPDSDDYEVHVLGGAKVPAKVLGGLPDNWRVLEFGEMDPKDFLSTLDVFVYYTHPDWVESFGRTILEAMAVGVPVILPPDFRELFKDAAVYAAPAEVKKNIDRLMADDGYYESQVRLARDYVEEHFGYTKHAARLKGELNRAE